MATKNKHVNFYADSNQPPQREIKVELLVNENFVHPAPNGKRKNNNKIFKLAKSRLNS
jgi:hypothetical protein